MEKSALALLLCVMYFPVSGTMAASDNTSITVSGKVVSNTCVIDDSKSDLSVRLDTISDRDIQKKGDTMGKRDVKIVLKDCGKDTKQVNVTVSGDPDADNTDAFRNASTTDAATGVGLYFYKTDGATLFKPAGSTEKSTLTPSTENTLTYKAAYVATKANPSAGGFTSVVNLKLDYQ